MVLSLSLELAAWKKSRNSWSRKDDFESLHALTQKALLDFLSHHGTSDHHELAQMYLKDFEGIHRRKPPKRGQPLNKDLRPRPNGIVVQRFHYICCVIVFNLLSLLQLCLLCCVSVVVVATIAVFIFFCGSCCYYCCVFIVLW